MSETTIEEFANRAYNSDKATEVAVMISNLIEMNRGQYSFSEWCTGFGSALAVNTHNKIVQGLATTVNEAKKIG